MTRRKHFEGQINLVLGAPAFTNLLPLLIKHCKEAVEGLFKNGGGSGQ